MEGVRCHDCMAHYLYATVLAPVKKRLSCSSNSASPPPVHTFKTATNLLKVRHSIPHTLTYHITSLSCLVQEGKPFEPHLQCNWQTIETRTRPQLKHLIPILQNAGFFLQAILHRRTPHSDLDSESVFEDIYQESHRSRANHRRSPQSSQR